MLWIKRPYFGNLRQLPFPLDPGLFVQEPLMSELKSFHLYFVTARNMCKNRWYPRRGHRFVMTSWLSRQETIPFQRLDELNVALHEGSTTNANGVYQKIAFVLPSRRNVSLFQQTYYHKIVDKNTWKELWRENRTIAKLQTHQAPKKNLRALRRSLWIGENKPISEAF